MAMIICGKDCDDCIHQLTSDEDKREFKVFCAAREKTYRYGQAINCDDRVTVKNEE